MDQLYLFFPTYWNMWKNSCEMEGYGWNTEESGNRQSVPYILSSLEGEGQWEDFFKSRLMEASSFLLAYVKRALLNSILGCSNLKYHS